MSEAQNEILLELVGTQVASKSDIHELKAEFRSDIIELRAEFKADIAELRAELKADIAELRAELKADISALRTELARLNGRLTLLYWMFGFLLASNMAIIVKLFIR